MFLENEFKALLVKKGKTIKEVADYLGISIVTMYRKMSGESDFYREEIQKICVFLEEKNLNYIFFAE